jgi:hypothetical protein
MDRHARRPQPDQSGASVSATNLSNNATIAAAGGSVNFDFLGSWSGTNTKPTTFTVNGKTCAAAT